MISAVIPAYNEADNVGSAVREVRTALERAGVEGEVIVVDDHSTDDTLRRAVAAEPDRVRGIRLSRRSGSHAALRAGLAEARGDAVLCLSADGQDDPEALPEMIEKWRGGAKVVWAVRRRRNEPAGQKLFALLFYRLIRWMGMGSAGDVDLARADFYLLDRSVADAVNACSERNTSLFGLIAWVGFRQDSVTYDRRPRRSGASKWTMRSRLNLAWDWVIGFSGLPLRLITMTGLATAAVGFLYAVFLVFYTLAGHVRPGFAEQTVLLLLLSGLQLTMLGIMGEYLWRNIEESRRRPLYFIEDRLGGAGGGGP